MDEADLSSYRECIELANSSYLALCRERGVDPLRSALDFEDSNASSQQKDDEEPLKQPKTKRSTKRTRSRRKQKKVALDGPPALEHIEDDDAADGVEEDGDGDDGDDGDDGERKEEEDGDDDDEDEDVDLSPVRFHFF